MQSPRLLLLPALLFLLLYPATARTDGEGAAFSEGAASALGNMMKEVGAPIAAGSIPVVEHIINNWDTLNNPCRNTLKLLGAILQDARDGTGDKFADVITNTFKIKHLTGTSYQNLITQGEYLSNRIRRNRTKNLRAIHRAMSEIRQRCYPPKKKPATSVAAAPSPAVSTGAEDDTTPATPASTPEPLKPEKPPEPPPPPEPEWSMDNPCPECQPTADELADEKTNMQDLQTQRGKLDKDLIDNQLEQGELGRQIASLTARIESQKGTLAESFDPESGQTVRAENVGDGKVKVTTRDGNGNITNEYTRDSGSARDMKKKAKENQKKLKELKKQEEKLNAAIAKLETKLDASQQKINELMEALEKCIAEKCKKGPSAKDLISMPDDTISTEPAGFCQAPLNYETIAIGPKAKIGGGVGKAIEKKAKGMVGGMLGGVVKGSPISFGGGGDKKPKMQKDPIKNKQTFTDPGTGIEVNIGGKFDDDGRVLISSEIENAPGKGTFHHAEIFNMNCQRMLPAEYYRYDLYLEWSLSVQYTTTTNYYQDGVLVDTTVEQSDWMEMDSGREFLGGSMFALQGKYDGSVQEGIWSKMGYDSAAGGLKSLGTKFNATRTDFSLPMVYSVYITDPLSDPVTATPQNFFACPDDDGGLTFTPVRDYLRMKYSGGMTSIDPPTMNLDALDSEMPDSVVDELQPDTFGGAAPDTGGTQTADSGDDGELRIDPRALRLGKMGGGMTSIDPPTIDLDAGEPPAEGSVMDQLEPQPSGKRIYPRIDPFGPLSLCAEYNYDNGQTVTDDAWKDNLQSHFDSLSPRIGFTYDIRGDGERVLRSSYGEHDTPVLVDGTPVQRSDTQPPAGDAESDFMLNFLKAFGGIDSKK